MDDGDWEDIRPKLRSSETAAEDDHDSGDLSQAQLLAALLEDDAYEPSLLKKDNSSARPSWARPALGQRQEQLAGSAGAGDRAVLPAGAAPQPASNNSPAPEWSGLFPQLKKKRPR